MTLTGESSELTGVAAGDGKEASRSKVALTGVAGRSTAAAAAGVAGVGEERVRSSRFRAPRHDSFDGETPRVTAELLACSASLGEARTAAIVGDLRRIFWAAWRRGGDSSRVWVAGRATARDYIGQGPLVPRASTPFGPAWWLEPGPKAQKTGANSSVLFNIRPHIFKHSNI